MKNKVVLVFCEILYAMQAILQLTSWKAEAQYDTAWVKKQMGKGKKRVLAAEILNPWMAKSHKILIFAKPESTEKSLGSGMPCPAMLSPLLASNNISDTGIFLPWRLPLFAKSRD